MHSHHSAGAAIQLLHGVECLDKGLQEECAKACFRKQVFLIFTDPDNLI